MKLYYHKTDGGAEYLCTSPVEGTDEGDLWTTIIRLDGEPEFLNILYAAAPELLEALELSTNILAETTGNLPNPGYGWIERKVDARITKNRAIIKAATG